MELTRIAGDAVLVACDDERHPPVLTAWLREQAVAREVVPGADTVLLDGVTDRAALPGLLRGWVPDDEAPAPQLVTIETTYDGEDLPAVAQVLGTSVEAVVRRHQETTWTARFCGFAPGFSYLAGWDDRVPRLATPRTQVPPGAVALADRWCGIYPVASPGGWQLIGRTEAPLWDPRRDPPALLSPGTPVRFVAAR